MWTSTKQDSFYCWTSIYVTTKLSINGKSCTTFTTDVQNVRRLQRHKHGGAWALRHFYTFQQDGAPAHCTRETEGLELLIRETPDFIPPSLCPPNGPDLNSVDYTVWGVLQERVYMEKIRTGGVAAAHYGGAGTPRPACHRQRSETVAYAPPCLRRCKRRTF